MLKVFISILILNIFVFANTITITIINSKVKILKEPTDKSKLVTTNKNLFKKSFEIKDKRAGFIRIDLGNGARSWIKTNDKVLLKANYKGRVYAKTFKNSQLKEKAVVVNMITDNRNINRVNIFKDPSLTDRVTNISLFEVRYIFAETDNAVLLGKQDRFTKDTAEDILIGWIDKEHIKKWNTRVGLEFNKDTFKERKNHLANIFLTENDMIKYLENGKGSGIGIFKEKNTKEPLEFFRRRYPLLENMGDYYKMLFIGKGVSGNKSFSKEEIEDEIKKTDEIRKDRELKIAVLIDATKGMGKYIKNVKEALKKFFTTFENSKNVQIAIAVYRDYVDGDKAFQVKQNFTNNVNQLNSALDSISVYSNPKDIGKGAYPEAMFLGIDSTMSDKHLNWKNKKGEKYLILIGDHGNHEHDKRFSESYITKKLQKNRVSLYAIQTNITTNPSAQRKLLANKLFENQITNIIGSEDIFGKFTKVYSNSTINIYNALNNANKSFKLIRNVIVDVRNNEDEGKYDGFFVDKVLQRYNINPEIFKSVQGTSIGFISPKNFHGIKQTKERVLMTKREVESLKVGMQNLSYQISDFSQKLSTEEELKNVIKESVKSLTGDKPNDDEPIDDFIKRKSAIPIQTDMLGFSINQLIEELEKESFKNEFIAYLQKKILKLEEVIHEKETEIIDVDENGIITFSMKHDKKIPYFFSIEQPTKRDLHYSQKVDVWLPLDYLP